MQFRRLQITLALVLTLDLLSEVPSQRAVAEVGTPTQTSPVVGRASELPEDTPVARQLAWVTTLVNGGVDTLTKAGFEARFAPSFLETVPAADAGIKQFAATYGPLTVDGPVRTPTETHSLMFLTTRTGEELIMSITVEPTVPHRITTLTFQPVPNGLTEAAASPEITGGLVSIDDRSLCLWCLGPDPADGEPTVLLEAGHGNDSTVWLAVQAALASTARVCSYDRANAPGGASDPAMTPRTGQDVVTDLHALLEAADVPGPYVLVGHSLGGIFVRQYASAHPDEVVGLVLVDPSHEDQEIRLKMLAGPEL